MIRIATIQQNDKILIPKYTDLTASRPTSSFAVVRATFTKELIIKRRYLANLLGQMVRIMLFILIFWFFANALEFHDIFDSSRKAVFIFYLAGFSIMMYDGVALWTPYETVRTDLTNGTLESLYSTPSSKYAYFLGAILAEALISSIFVIPVFITVMYVANLEATNLIMFLVVLVTTLLVLIVFGVMIALSAIMWKQVGAIIGVIGSLFTFVSGGLIPVQSFPVGLKYFAYIFPYTWGYDLLRYYAFDGQWETLLPIWMEWTILISMFGFFALVSKRMVGRVSNHVKNKGLHIL
ncbi:MAG: ABC transporter permease [Candidatus Kariarchaeaceae archaeon]